MTRHVRWITTTALGALLLAGGAGCGDETVTPPPNKVDVGWTAFASGDLDEAKTQFESALADDPGDSEANNGLGWTRLRLDELDGAITSFEAALTNGFTGPDPDAGKAIILRDRVPLDYPAAISAALAALAKNANFVFSHDTSLDWRDLRLVLAHAYYATGAYGSAGAEVTALGGTAPDSQADDYPRQLLAEIERLTRQYGG